MIREGIPAAIATKTQNNFPRCNGLAERAENTRRKPFPQADHLPPSKVLSNQSTTERMSSVLAHREEEGLARQIASQQLSVGPISMHPGISFTNAIPKESQIPMPNCPNPVPLQNDNLNSYIQPPIFQPENALLHPTPMMQNLLQPQDNPIPISNMPYPMNPDTPLKVLDLSQRHASVIPSGVSQQMEQLSGKRIHLDFSQYDSESTKDQNNHSDDTSLTNVDNLDFIEMLRNGDKKYQSTGILNQISDQPLEQSPNQAPCAPFMNVTETPKQFPSPTGNVDILDASSPVDNCFRQIPNMLPDAMEIPPVITGTSNVLLDTFIDHVTQIYQRYDPHAPGFFQQIHKLYFEYLVSFEPFKTYKYHTFLVWYHKDN